MTSIKYEEVYLRAYESVSEARASIGRYLNFYNGRRPHASLDGSTPDQAYFDPLPFWYAPLCITSALWNPCKMSWLGSGT